MRTLIPEVIQTSAMDCGPAVLKAILEGFGIDCSYGRLREACQTDVDGTSIDTLEELAGLLGLDASQVLIPVDHLLLDEADALPAIVVVKQPNGFTHFVALWRRHGPLVQFMDPSSGRQFMAASTFLRRVYVHTATLPAAMWREWAGSDGFLVPLRRRFDAIVSRAVTDELLARAVDDPSWRGLARLDAAVRMVGALVRARAIGAGERAARLLTALLQGEDVGIPELYWSVRSAATLPESEPGGDESVQVRGAVLVRVGQKGVKEGKATKAAPADHGEAPPSPPAELVAALREPPARPLRELWRALRADGVFRPAMIVVALVLASLGTIAEALVLRGAIDVARDLSLFSQRVAAVAMMVALAVALLLLDGVHLTGLLALGRRVETRLRVALLAKIPRLEVRYFGSRPVSDMAERAHSLHSLRQLPPLGGQLMRGICELLAVAGALVWVHSRGAPIVIGAVLLTIGIPLLGQPALRERDARVRTHVGALGRFYLDALLGLVPIRTHGAERAVRREHESLLVEWTEATRAMLRAALAVDGLQMIAGIGMAAWLLLDYLAGVHHVAGALLVAYWALLLPALADDVAVVMRQYPRERNLMLRALEPLGALEGDAAPWSSDPTPARETPPSTTPSASGSAGLALALREVHVKLAGYPVLQDLTLTVAPGEKVAIVGASGAGKSTLVGLLLGWHRASAGEVLVDGMPLDGTRIAELRRNTAWVGAGVQLWNRSLLENLRYGRPEGASSEDAVLHDAELTGLLQTLGDGLQTPLGEGGRIVSGGEGQRVRLGRALERGPMRLVLCDEPFRGLDAATRARLYARTRTRWADATVLCVMHDIGAALEFDRVVVMADGGIVEDDAPGRLMARDSRLRAMRDAEVSVRALLRDSRSWRRIALEDGRLEVGEGGRSE